MYIVVAHINVNQFALIACKCNPSVIYSDLNQSNVLVVKKIFTIVTSLMLLSQI